MSQRGSSGFDVSKITTASKILLVSGMLLLLDSFLAWQEICASEVTGVDLGNLGINDVCGRASMWGGDARILGVLAGFALIALVVWEILILADVDVSVPIESSKLAAYLGFGVLALVVLKFVFVVTNQIAIGAWLGLLLALAVGYGAYMRLQAPNGSVPPPPGSSEGGGFTS